MASDLYEASETIHARTMSHVTGLLSQCAIFDSLDLADSSEYFKNPYNRKQLDVFRDTLIKFYFQMFEIQDLSQVAQRCLLFHTVTDYVGNNARIVSELAGMVEFIRISMIQGDTTT